jgi:F0F1-type ATP synthase assembly protein I
MAKFLSSLLGVVAGFLLAHLVNTTPQGKTVFARIGATVNSFVSGVRDAYRS